MNDLHLYEVEVEKIRKNMNTKADNLIAMPNQSTVEFFWILFNNLFFCNVLSLTRTIYTIYMHQESEGRKKTS